MAFEELFEAENHLYKVINVSVTRTNQNQKQIKIFKKKETKKIAFNLTFFPLFIF